MNESAVGGNSSSITNSTLVEAFASACFWASLALSFFGQGYQASITYDVLVPAVFIPTGSALALLVVGLMGPHVMGKRIFVLGLGLCILSLPFKALLYVYPYQTLSEWFSLINSGICAIYVLGWCDRVSRIDTRQIMHFALPSTLIMVVLIVGSLLMNYQAADWYSEVLLLVSAVFGVVTASHVSADNTEAAVRISPLTMVVLFIFGALVSVLSLVSKDLFSGGSNLDDPFVFVWMILTLLVLGWALYYLHHHPYLSKFLVVLLPIGTACLLVPPFAVLQFERVVQALLACVIICEAIVYSITPSNALSTFRLGKVQFTFWQRSWGIVGIDIGFIFSSILCVVYPKFFTFNTAVLLFLIGLILFLTLAMLLGRMGYKFVEDTTGSSEDSSKIQVDNCSVCERRGSLTIQTSIDKVCQAVGKEYGLTVREEEILQLLAAGRSLPYIQEQLTIAPSTAATHVNHIYKKLSVHSKQELLNLIYQR